MKSSTKKNLVKVGIGAAVLAAGAAIAAFFRFKKAAKKSDKPASKPKKAAKSKKKGKKK